MKELLIKALDSAFELMNKSMLLTKKSNKFLNIGDVEPTKLLDFIVKNNIPNDCYFSVVGEDFENKYPILSWEVDIPTTAEDKLSFQRAKFTRLADLAIHKVLTENGYKRQGYCSETFDSLQIGSQTLFDVYIYKYFDKIVDYYYLYYTKP
jgi:hypothetical protein